MSAPGEPTASPVSPAPTPRVTAAALLVGAGYYAVVVRRRIAGRSVEDELAIVRAAGSV